MLTMRLVKVLLVYLSCACHARRIGIATQRSVKELQSNPEAVDAAAAFNPSLAGASSAIRYPSHPVAARAPPIVAQADERLRRQLDQQRDQLNEERQRVRALRDENKQIPNLERQLQRQEKEYEKTLKAQGELKEQLAKLKEQISKQEDAIKEGDATNVALEKQTGKAEKALNETEVKLETTLKTLQVLLSEQEQMKAQLKMQGQATEVLVQSDREQILAAELDTTKKEVDMLRAREMQLMTQMKVMEKNLAVKQDFKGNYSDYSLASINTTADERALAFRLAVLEKQQDNARQMSLASSARIAAAEQNEMSVRKELESVKEKLEIDVKTLSDEMLKREDMAEQAQTQVQKLERKLENALREGERATRFQEKLKEVEKALRDSQNSSTSLGEQNVALAKERDELRSVFSKLGISENVTASIPTAEVQLEAAKAEELAAKDKKQDTGLGDLFAKLFNF